MSTISDIAAANVSAAWAGALTALLDAADHRTVNLVIRIADPVSEDRRTREIAERLLDDLDQQSIDEVANTIFPSEWAKDFPEPSELAADYRLHYPLLKQIDRKNHRATYFGRIVEYPAGRGSTGSQGSEELVDQLSATVDKLREGLRKGKVFASIYELSIYHPARDGRVSIGFPCLAHLGLHLDGERRLCGTAQYRSHTVVPKGYGNYVGLGGLLAYIAEAAELEVGELLIVAGGAFLEGSITRMRAARQELEGLT